MSALRRCGLLWCPRWALRRGAVSAGLIVLGLGAMLSAGGAGRVWAQAPPRVMHAATPLPEPVYTGALMSVHGQDLDVREALQMVAEFTRFNIVVSDGVQGKISLRLHRLPWDQVLEVIAQTRGLHVRRQGAVIWVATRAEVAARDKAQLEAWQAAQQLEPVQTHHFALHYARARDVQARLQGQAPAGAPTATASPVSGGAGPVATPPSRVLSARGSVVADARTNQLFVTDVPERLAHVAQMVALMDVPLRQVLIEARIVQANDSFGQTLGCAWAKPAGWAAPRKPPSRWAPMACGSICPRPVWAASSQRDGLCRFFSPGNTDCCNSNSPL